MRFLRKLLERWRNRPQKACITRHGSCCFFCGAKDAGDCVITKVRGNDL